MFFLIFLAESLMNKFSVSAISNRTVQLLINQPRVSAALFHRTTVGIGGLLTFFLLHWARSHDCNVYNVLSRHLIWCNGSKFGEEVVRPASYAKLSEINTKFN